MDLFSIPWQIWLYVVLLAFCIQEVRTVFVEFLNFIIWSVVFPYKIITRNRIEGDQLVFFNKVKEALESKKYTVCENTKDSLWVVLKISGKDILFISNVKGEAYGFKTRNDQGESLSLSNVSSYKAEKLMEDHFSAVLEKENQDKVNQSQAQKTALIKEILS